MLIAIAHAFHVTPVLVFRKAGLLPDGGEEVQIEDWQYLLSQLSAEDQEEMRQLAIMKIERKKKSGNLKTLKTKKAG